jgi:predicted dehydrogenase
MKSINRRHFLAGSLGSVAAASMLGTSKSFGANEKIRLGMIGVGGRGTYLLERLVQMPEVEIACLCDVDTRRFAKAREIVVEADRKRPRLEQDFRKMLDDPGIDAVVIATPPHWHCLATIMACQAGKDVYVEKALSHDVYEGRKAVEAARKYDRVVQVGSQNRSAPYFHDALEYIHSGKLGNVNIVRVNQLFDIKQQVKGASEPVPKGLNWDMWCGPGPLVSYSPGRWWLSDWRFSDGYVGDDAAHQLDIARAFVGEKHPNSVHHVGGHYLKEKLTDIPDTQIVTYEYDNTTLVFQGATWMPYMKKTPNSIRDTDSYPSWMFNTTKVEVLGTEGYMVFGRMGGGWQAFDGDGNMVESRFGRQPINEHLQNFVDCIKTRKRPNADIEHGHLSMSMYHLASVSYKAGNEKIVFDGETETITNNKEANNYLKHEYREPWQIPDKV